MNNGLLTVAPSVFREACRRWARDLPSSAARLEAYTFVDVGRGKGRAYCWCGAALSQSDWRGIMKARRASAKNITLWKHLGAAERNP